MGLWRRQRVDFADVSVVAVDTAKTALDQTLVNAKVRNVSRRPNEFPAEAGRLRASFPIIPLP